MKSNERQDGLQALRLVAALLVVITHATFYTHERLSAAMPVWSPGAIGVDIFFVISGYVMMLTGRNFIGAVDGWKKFAVRRIVRIGPMYWLATTIKLISLLVLPSVVLHAELEPAKVVLSYLFLPSTNVDGRFEPLLGVGWTLIFEMFFYAIFTVGIFLKTNVVRFVGLVFLACCFISVFRQPDWNAATMYFHPIVAFFLIGMLFAEARDRYSAGLLFKAASVGLAIVALGVFFFDIQVAAKARSVAGVVTASLIVLAVIGAEPWLKGRIPNWVLFMGEASYVLYLFHPLIAPAVPQLMERFGLILPATSVLLSIAAALIGSAVIHKFVELPINNWLRPRIPFASSSSKVSNAPITPN